MIHDWGMSQKWVVFQLLPLLVDLNRIETGGQYWEWDDDQPTYYGVFPRVGGKPSDIKWLPFPVCDLCIRTQWQGKLKCLVDRTPSRVTSQTPLTRLMEKSLSTVLLPMEYAYHLSPHLSLCLFSAGLICSVHLPSQNVFTWFPNKFGEAPPPETLRSPFIRWTFDPKTATQLPEPEILSEAWTGECRTHL
jgi:hypothetical protein